jgi:hypothetical protein
MEPTIAKCAEWIRFRVVRPEHEQLDSYGWWRAEYWLVLPDHPELRQHAASAVARHSLRGWRLDSPSRDTNIDAVIALCMALEHVEQQPDQAQLLGWS